jgi:hypothetical protein
MAVRIDLPIDQDELEPPPLRVDAVVVRCEPHPFEPRVYHLALFFPSLEDYERQRLSRFVRSRREAEQLATGRPGAES